MKKILAILVLLTAASWGQSWTGQKSSVNTFGKYTVQKAGDSVASQVYVVDTLKAKVKLSGTDSIIVRHTNPQPVVVSPNTSDAHSYFDVDTLIMSSTGADTTGSGSTNDTLIHYYQGKFLYGFVCIDDSQKAASGALTDSIYVDRYDTATATWRAAMVGFKNLYDNVVYGNPLVPGNNVQKMYLINEPYPMTYRVRYATYWGNAGNLVRKTIIRWVWKAQ